MGFTNIGITGINAGPETKFYNFIGLIITFYSTVRLYHDTKPYNLSQYDS